MTKRQKKEKQMHYFWILRISPYIEVAQSFYSKKTHILIKYAIR
ncbi:DEHA2G00440p [Debaryomyces hansenii CBS767]|uniref:DEHA2G00440p n=1 Tax=Debaryomyces hansenii (strain ATCC 36239 / CBS 767 / BCRC 21394 / JCM 1990 / NBRC 0083 / IGC 2968) TaxID=284592 RepID=Q6BJR9_DEBHA|nr:DEHA2G00440p [Debaryomyces hansenii CBS767]CAG89996.2 DEHA2G00440p [Debaryomyces hansenii CBS767]|eukprot:XP_461552.2 DEHA2G00440p [Debaryomyces hansenii CBS767]